MIKDDKEYKEALHLIDMCINSQPGSFGEHMLICLSEQVQEYEHSHFKIRKPSLRTRIKKLFKR